MPAARVLRPSEFIGEPVTMPVGGDLLTGKVISYDAERRLWGVRFESRVHGPSTASLAAAELAKYGPRNATCPAQPGSSEHAVEAYLAARPRGEAAWYVVDPGLTPYRRRLWAKLTTGSDFAVCRGKRGATSHQSCTCRARALETTTHALFECEFYDAIRPPLIAASTAWCLESGIPANDAGRAAALRWAATALRPACASASASASADCVLRDSIATFYAQAMSIRFNKSTSKSTDQGAASQPSSPE